MELALDVKKFLWERESNRCILGHSSAYDNVKRIILIEKLKKENCPERIIKFVNEWMRERRVQFIISEKESETRILNQGLPQEGVLSPILYAIYTKDIRKKIDEDITVLQFADDVVLYNTGKGNKDKFYN